MKLRSVTATRKHDPHAAAAFTKLMDLTDLAFERAVCYHNSIPDPKGSATGDAHENVPGQEAEEPAQSNTRRCPENNARYPIHTLVLE